MYFNFTKTSNHGSKAVFYAKLVMVSEKQTNLLYWALTTFGISLYQLYEYKKAKANFEECYVLILDPTNHLSFKIANELIDTLIRLKEYHTAERYACHWYDSLMEIDKESIDVSSAAE